MTSHLKEEYQCPGMNSLWSLLMILMTHDLNVTVESFTIVIIAECLMKSLGEDNERLSNWSIQEEQRERRRKDPGIVGDPLQSMSGVNAQISAGR